MSNIYDENNPFYDAKLIARKKHYRKLHETETERKMRDKIKLDLMNNYEINNEEDKLVLETKFGKGRFRRDMPKNYNQLLDAQKAQAVEDVLDTVVDSIIDGNQPK